MIGIVRSFISSLFRLQYIAGVLMLGYLKSSQRIPQERKICLRIGLFVPQADDSAYYFLVRFKVNTCS
jgi:hypothetical protein